MGKKTSYIGDDMDDFDDEHGAGEDETHAEHGRRESRQGHRDTARHRLDMRQDELWLKQQLADWDEETYDDNEYV